jgi:hypothetical protein
MILATARVAPCSPDDGRTAIRHALPTVDLDGEWLESYAPDAFLPITSDRPPTVLDRHDGVEIGHVFALNAGSLWWEAQLVLDEDARALARVGAAVSIDARSLGCDDDRLSRSRRHRVVVLDHVAFVARDERAGYPGAVITAVRHVKPKPPASRARGEHVGDEVIEHNAVLVRHFDDAIIRVY